jgi:hypothetical protein
VATGYNALLTEKAGWFYYYAPLKCLSQRHTTYLSATRERNSSFTALRTSALCLSTDILRIAEKQSKEVFKQLSMLPYPKHLHRTCREDFFSLVSRP